LTAKQLPRLNLLSFCSLCKNFESIAPQAAAIVACYILQVLIKLRLAPATAVILSALTLTACASPVADSTDAASSSREAAALTTSSAMYVSVENALSPLGDAMQGPEITWKVSQTKNEFWDGSSRPDHNPPRGLQGLTQAAGSGSVKVRTEVNTSAFGSDETPNFVLTPVVQIGDASLPLHGLSFQTNVDDAEYWRVWTTFDMADLSMADVCKKPLDDSVGTGARTFSYRITATCDLNNRLTSIRLTS
jgi:hypothetical protein